MSYCPLIEANPKVLMPRVDENKASQTAAGSRHLPEFGKFWKTNFLIFSDFSLLLPCIIFRIHRHNSTYLPGNTLIQHISPPYSPHPLLPSLI